MNEKAKVNRWGLIKDHLCHLLWLKKDGLLQDMEERSDFIRYVQGLVSEDSFLRTEELVKFDRLLAEAVDALPVAMLQEASLEQLEADGEIEF